MPFRSKPLFIPTKHNKIGEKQTPKNLGQIFDSTLAEAKLRGLKCRHSYNRPEHAPKTEGKDHSLKNLRQAQGVCGPPLSRA